VSPADGVCDPPPRCQTNPTGLTASSGTPSPLISPALLGPCTCGNGVTNSGEQCDDGNQESCDGCDFNCTASTVCGNGVVCGSEECDDGNTAGGDGCSLNCTLEPGWICDRDDSFAGAPTVCKPVCGDGTRTAGEECDDGNKVDGDGCSATCRKERGWCCSGDANCLPPAGKLCTTICGDGLLRLGEACDDGNRVDGDGCNNDCTVTTGFRCFGEPSQCSQGCGNGTVGPGEECDDGNFNNNDACKNDCTNSRCGDFYRNCGSDGICANADDVEGCDDGSVCLGGDNNGFFCLPGNPLWCPGGTCEPRSGHGCSNQCQVEPGYQCGAFFGSCTPICGDGAIVGSEQCDDGSQINGDGCDSNCTFTACGNGIVTAGEECDDGDPFDGNGCQRDCTITRCGNGVRDLDEQCDDGNLIDDDGCDSNCTVSGCGNGVVNAGEECDDGNREDLDFCKTDCTLNACGDGQQLSVPYQLATVPFAWIDISGQSPTPVPLGDDQVTNPGIQLPFDFTFFGQKLAQGTRFFISSNGFISFDPNVNSGCCSGEPLPRPGGPGNSLIAAFWTDLNPGAGGSYSYARVGNDLLVIQVSDVPLYGGPATVSLQYRLYGSNAGNRIEIHYRNAQPGFRFVTAGIENSNGTLGYQHYAGERALVETAVAYVPIAVEKCDQGNHANGDGCDDDPANAGNCTATACGNGVVTAGEECDDGDGSSNNACKNNCTFNACGDGILNFGPDAVRGTTDDVEVCDDGGVCVGGSSDQGACTLGSTSQCPGGACQPRDADGCSVTCQLEAGWECPAPGKACNSICGDGRMVGSEQCDDGNRTNGDGCDDDPARKGNCTPTACGNGVETAGEACDDGNRDPQHRTYCIITNPGGTPQANNTLPDPNCALARCGDGRTCEDASCAAHSLAEECDLSSQNGVESSGCRYDCTFARVSACRRRVTKLQVKFPRGRSTQTICADGAQWCGRRVVCPDGATWCDADGRVDGKCEFSVDVCGLVQTLPRVRGKDMDNPRDLQSVQVLGVDTHECWQRDAAGALGQMIMDLAPQAAEVRGRCINRRSGNGPCTLGQDSQCDSKRGAGDGVCAPEVLFSSSLSGHMCSSFNASQPDPIVVPAGKTMRLETKAVGYCGNDSEGYKLVQDREKMKLVCRPAPVSPPLPTWTVGPCALGTATETPTATPTITPTSTPSDTPTPVPTATATSSPTITRTATRTPTSTRTTTPTRTPRR
jgi:cysteine-rich repeat protein